MQRKPVDLQGELHIWNLRYTKILEVNLLAFACRLLHEDFSAIDGTLHLRYLFQMVVSGSGGVLIDMEFQSPLLLVEVIPDQWENYLEEIVKGIRFTEGDHTQGINSGWRGLWTEAILSRGDIIQRLLCLEGKLPACIIYQVL